MITLHAGALLDNLLALDPHSGDASNEKKGSDSGGA